LALTVRKLSKREHDYVAAGRELDGPRLQHREDRLPSGRIAALREQRPCLLRSIGEELPCSVGSQVLLGPLEELVRRDMYADPSHVRSGSRPLEAGERKTGNAAILFDDPRTRVPANRVRREHM